MRRCLPLVLLLGLTLTGCWVTGGEIQSKIDEADLPDPADTGDTGVTAEATPPAR